MNMETQSSNTIDKIKKLGFHYYPDTLHYQYSDLQKWLPKLAALKATWLVLISNPYRAIPEFFIQGLIENGINPLIHINEKPANEIDLSETTPLLDVYAKWGVKQVVLYDKPNMRSSWHSSEWIQGDIVDKFISRFLPLALKTIENGMTPVIPPLVPGGDLWDTIFLKNLLEKLSTANTTKLLDYIALSSNNWHWNHNLSWGRGGPEKWTSAKPYMNLENEEDHRGFHIFEWYLSITNSILGKTLPIILLGAGAAGVDNQYLIEPQPQDKHLDNIINIAKSIDGERHPNSDFIV